MKHCAQIIPITDDLQCEGCGKIATGFDPEGVPVCELCAESYLLVIDGGETP